MKPFFISRFHFLIFAVGLAGAIPQTVSAQIIDASAVTAELRPMQPIVTAGQPVWIDFLIHNPTDRVTILYQPGSTKLELNSPEMGLPKEHVLGYGDAPSLTIQPVGSKEIGALVVERPSKPSDEAVAIRLAPAATVGLRLDLLPICPTLAQPGQYRILWQPYQGKVNPAELTIRVVSLKQAKIETDAGTMTLRFLYDKAPHHVQNFIELAQQGFYDNRAFHRIEPGMLIQGGSPNDNPAGIRPDGVKLAPEFNDHPFDRGTVGMARFPDDPNSASCQFFICAARWPELDGQYTAFAELIGDESFQTLDKLMASKIDSNGKPVKTLYIRAIRIEDIKQVQPPSPLK